MAIDVDDVHLGELWARCLFALDERERIEHTSAERVRATASSLCRLGRPRVERGAHFACGIEGSLAGSLTPRVAGAADAGVAENVESGRVAASRLHERVRGETRGVGADGGPSCGVLGSSVAAAPGSPVPLDRRGGRDPLTRVSDGSWSQQRIDPERPHWERNSAPLTLAIAGLDDLAGIDPRHGRAAAEQALAGLAGDLRVWLRGSGLVARDRGNTLLIVFPTSGSVDAVRTLDAARAQLARRGCFYRGARLDISVSVGVAELRCGDDMRLARARAERALYEARRAGCNRVATG